MRALIIEDDEKIGSYIANGLRDEGFTVDLSCNGTDGLKLALSKTHDIIIVDLMLPGTDGITVIETLRQKNLNTPVIIVSAKESVDDRVRGLQKGGDDYLTKPFAFSELLARTRALLRRSKIIPESATQLKAGDLSIDMLSREVMRGKKRIELQPREFALLELFMKHNEQIISKRLITESIWHFNFDPGTNVVDVLVCRLRNKIDRDFGTKLIHTVRGLGYVLKPEKK